MTEYTNKDEINNSADLIPQQRRELERVLGCVMDDDLEVFLFESHDLNFQLSALKAFADNLGGELAEYTDELEHIFDTFIYQLEDATDALDDPNGQVAVKLLSFLLSKPTFKTGSTQAERVEPTWSWPVINVPQSKVTDPGYAEDWNTMSPLKMFGYTVGRTNGWDAHKRKRFLDDFMTYDLPNIVTETYGDYYGEPNSVARLKATAQLFASLITSAKRKRGNSMRYAIDDWTDDLGYLKSVYYEGKGLKFYSWPTTSLR